MSLIERTIQLSFQQRVYFTRNVFGVLNPMLKEIVKGEVQELPKSMVVLDESLHLAQPDLAHNIEAYFDHHSSELHLACPPMILEGGERVKNSYFHVSEIQSRMDRFNIDRHSYVLAVGGGALLDVVGLAAATAHRGVRHVRIPTTTLSQADSGVGVKNGINSFGKKNFIGTFAVPYAVINDFEMLGSLPPRDKRAGYIEAVKVALIRDAKFFDNIETNAVQLHRFDPRPMQDLIYRSAELHLTHIASGGDPFELGSARPLDFGHWAAHKLEQLSEYRIRHGEAVAIGLALDVIYSRRKGFLPKEECERILRLVEALGFELFANEVMNVDSDGAWMILKGLEEFRQHLGGRLTITMLKGIGRGFEVHEIDEVTVLQAIHELEHRHARRQRRKPNDLDSMFATG